MLSEAVIYNSAVAAHYRTSRKLPLQYNTLACSLLLAYEDVYWYMLWLATARYLVFQVVEERQKLTLRQTDPSCLKPAINA